MCFGRRKTSLNKCRSGKMGDMERRANLQGGPNLRKDQLTAAVKTILMHKKIRGKASKSRSWVPTEVVCVCRSLLWSKPEWHLLVLLLDK